MSDNNSWMNAVLVLLGASLGAAAVMAATSSTAKKPANGNVRRRRVPSNEPEPVAANPHRMQEQIPEKDQPDPDSSSEHGDGGGTANGWVYWL